MMMIEYVVIIQAMELPRYSLGWMFLRSFLSRFRVSAPSSVYVSSPKYFLSRGITSSILRFQSNTTTTSPISTVTSSTSLPSSQVEELEKHMIRYNAIKNDPFLLVKAESMKQFDEIRNFLHDKEINLNNEMKVLNDQLEVLNDEGKTVYNQLLEGKILNEVAMMLHKRNEGICRQLQDLRQQLQGLRKQLQKLEDTRQQIINEIRETNYLSSFKTWTSSTVPDMSSKVVLLQNFETYRQESYYFVDKSSFIQPLLEKERVVFRRPRRYGKSLTLSMLNYFFCGATGLFHGLDVYKQDFPVDNFHWSPNDSTKHNFPPCPAIHLDFSFPCKSAQDFNLTLIDELLIQAKRCGVSNFTSKENELPSKLLERLITTLCHNPLNKWEKVVILIDEYDAPVRSTLDNHEKDKVLESISDFFHTIKSLDAFVQFAYVTGIESHSLAGLFSGANNFTDFTFDPLFENLCGYTQDETISILDKFNLPADNKILEQLRKQYNGYSYSLAPDSPDKPRRTIYHPYFINKYAGSNGVFGDYWGNTASRSLAANFSNFNPLNSSSSCSIVHLTNPLTLNEYYSPEYLNRKLVEAGYYTIKSVKGEQVTLDYPNEQIKKYALTDYFKIKRK